MKRNMKFLLLLAIFTSSIMAAYFITGCGDDSTVIENPSNTTANDTTVIIEETDQVIGTVHGKVTDAWDQSLLGDVTVTWINGDSSYSTTTSTGGWWNTPVDLASGEYEFTFSVDGHAVTTGWTNIPELDELRGGVADRPAGNIYVSDTLDMKLLPMTGNIHGIVYTALPAPPNKDGKPAMSLVDPDPRLVSVAGGVKVYLDYGFDIHPNKYDAITNADGTYDFINVPLWVGQYGGGEAGKEGPPVLALADDREVDLLTMPFTEGDSTFEGTKQENISMVPGAITYMPNVFAPLIGGNQVITNEPVILTYNFETPGFTVTDSLVINFSKPMETATMEIDIDGVDFAVSWGALDMVLTINPALSLVPDKSYDVTINGFAKDGLELYHGPWQRGCETQQGMRFIETNLDEYGDDENPFTEFLLGDDITITFDMDVVLPTPGDPLTGWVVLKDNSFGREVNADVTASGTTITIDPTQDLESFKEYELDFKVFSNLRGDSEEDSVVIGGNNDLTFTTVNTADIPPPPANFVLDMGANWVADWDDTSIDFQWDRSAGAEYYEIFAQDNKANSDFILVSSATDLDFNTWMEGNVDLTDDPNLQFDLYDDDNPLQTPFSGGTEISFKIRAVNSAGASAFTALAAPVADETAPTYAVIQTGSADNTAGTSPTFTVSIAENEYLSAVAFEFVEASAVLGGDPDYVLLPAAVDWSWENDMRHGSGVVWVADARCGSADSMIVLITDNSGNVGRTAIDLRPYIIFDDPIATTTDFEAANPDVVWTVYDVVSSPVITGNLDLFWSYNSGTDWLDTTLAWNAWDASPTTWTAFDTVFSTTFMLGLGDNDGGWMWTSDVFTYTGLMFVGMDSTIRLTTTFYDEEGTDSTGLDLTWDYAGLDSVAIWWWNDDDEEWDQDTVVPVTGGSGSLTWYPPDIGGNYECEVRIADWDADSRPAHDLGWMFDVVHDWVNLTAPLAGASVAGGSDYDITWNTVATASSEVGLAYVIGIDTTWIVAATANDGSYTWSVPADTYSDNTARLLVYDNLGNNILDQEGTFSISGLEVVAPVAGDEWLTGTSGVLEWVEHGTITTIDIYWSCDGFVSDTNIVLANTSSPANWSVPANSACATVTFLFLGVTGTDTVWVMSDEMIFSGIVVTSPVAGNLAQGATTSITWETIGTLVGNSVDIDFQYATENPVFTSAWIELAGAETNDGSWTWPSIPAPPAEIAHVRIEQAATGLGSDQGADFSISGVVLIDDFDGDVWSVGSANLINWNEVNSADVGDITIAIYEVTGSNHVADLQINVSDTFWTWTIPSGFPASDEYYIRIQSETTPSIFDVSGTFEVLPTVSITAPNGGQTWTLGTGGDITWTHTGLAVDIKLQYDDGTGGWTDIVGAGALTSVAGVNTWSWAADPTVDGALDASTTCRLRAETVAGPLIFDNSDADFELQPELTLTVPAGSETWTLGTAENLTWTHIGVVGNVKLQYAINGGAWTDIVGKTNLAPGASGGTSSWTLNPATDAGLAATTACQVRVMTIAAPLVSSTSTDLEILPSITVTAPSGGDTWNLGTPEDITWTHMGLLADVMIEYTLDASAGTPTWFSIFTGIPSGTLIYNWALDTGADVNLAISADCKVRVTAVSGPAAQSVTANFTIAP